jgi:hypothetical protein
MDRRPHWDAALIKAVFDAMVPEGTSRPMPDLAYAVIAAVEDWHRDRWTGVCESPEEVVRELKQAQAAIQRVREVCDLFQRRYDSSIRHPADIPAVAIVAVRRALDGDA